MLCTRIVGALTLRTCWLVTLGAVQKARSPRLSIKPAFEAAAPLMDAATVRALGRQFVLSGAMNRTLAFWTAFVSAFVASALALRVALNLALATQFGKESLVSELSMQSRVAAVAGLAALVSVIAQIIEKASK